MTEELELIYDELKSSNGKSLDHLENELTKVRAGKATPSMLSGVMVDFSKVDVGYMCTHRVQKVTVVRYYNDRVFIIGQEVF